MIRGMVMKRMALVVTSMGMIMLHMAISNAEMPK